MVVVIDLQSVVVLGNNWATLSPALGVYRLGQSILAVMTLADLESFVTGPAIYKCDSGLAQMHSPLAQKRKPQDLFGYDADDPYNVELFRITVSKILSQPVRRVEPSLKRFLLLKNLWKDLQGNVSSQSPCKRINLDMDQPNVDPEMVGETTALHNLHLTRESVATPHSFLQNTANTLSVHPTESSMEPLHSLPPISKESAVSPPMSIVADSLELTNPSLTVINSPTELVDMLPSYDTMDFQSLVQCSIDQFSTKTGSVDELDSIMQVLVSM